ncbi:hypothetical protein QBC38DRAFT_262148 [Podospora fimiseda]|uniref:Uncharacterized protein n=1 Tax=Podospora fimiseda TaxID=252190 RepID=A0AAN7H7L2_9PEZI|nr:hypothetical protein QBC38DRAFT_262148 [Podospora fimiseda]
MCSLIAVVQCSLNWEARRQNELPQRISTGGLQPNKNQPLARFSAVHLNGQDGLVFTGALSHSQSQCELCIISEAGGRTEMVTTRPLQGRCTNRPSYREKAEKNFTGPLPLVSISWKRQCAVLPATPTPSVGSEAYKADLVVYPETCHCAAKQTLGSASTRSFSICRKLPRGRSLPLEPLLNHVPCPRCTLLVVVSAEANLFSSLLTRITTALKIPTS